MQKEAKFSDCNRCNDKDCTEYEVVTLLDRKYSFTAEIKGDVEKKYKWTAEIEGDDVKKGKRGERKYQWMTEIKGKEDDKRGSSASRIVEIEESPDQRAVVLRQAFAKRAANGKGKKKELSPVDAAALIQYSFRAYLIRRSQALRALRELAIAKTKLKELRAMFHNFSYRSRVSRDAEERQKFSEKIIVLLLTVDAIEGVDVMVRAAKRSMVDELEAMLDVVEPQSDGKSLSMRRRTFDMPSGTIQKEIAEGVAQVVQMLDEENGTFEACL
uniref:BAG domain-containing protein n=1 Tax=Chenopodium quinoa TaxID=63459 RepID=A0A803KT37_CHEQI